MFLVFQSCVLSSVCVPSNCLITGCYVQVYRRWCGQPKTTDWQCTSSLYFFSTFSLDQTLFCLMIWCHVQHPVSPHWLQRPTVFSVPLSSSSWMMRPIDWQVSIIFLGGYYYLVWQLKCVVLRPVVSLHWSKRKEDVGDRCRRPPLVASITS